MESTELKKKTGNTFYDKQFFFQVNIYNAFLNEDFDI